MKTIKKLFILIVVSVFLSCVFEENQEIDYSKDFSFESHEEQDSCQTALEELINE